MLRLGMTPSCAPIDTEPIIVTLNSVKPDLTMVWAADDTIWLLPAYSFGSADGGIYTVMAVDDAYIKQPDPEVATTEPVIEPGVVTDTAVPPTPSVAPACAPVTEITTPTRNRRADRRCRGRLLRRRSSGSWPRPSATRCVSCARTASIWRSPPTSSEPHQRRRRERGSHRGRLHRLTLRSAAPVACQAMFDSLSSRLEGVIKKIRGKGRLTDDDVDEVLKEIRTALLEADVNVGVVRNVTARIREQAVGAKLSQALDPGQQIVKIVNSELTAMLGGETLKITYASRPPTVVLMAGLQGSGKTTNSAKLARWFKSQGRQPLMVGADLQRPAAVEQLRTLGRQIDVPVFSEPGDPVVDRASRSGGGPPPRPRRADRRHRRAPVDRRRDDGTGPPDQRRPCSPTTRSWSSTR